MRPTQICLYAHTVDFATSAPGTIGIEWELQLVDPVSGDLVGEAEQLLAAVDSDQVKGEFFTNTIELVTGVHDGVDSAIGQLRQLRDRSLAVAESMGFALVGMGLHPFANWREQTIASPDRYQRLRAMTGTWGSQQIILGVHTHIGTGDAQSALDLQKSLMESLPLILGLSASSPFWCGEDTGYASQRTMLFQQLPNAGVPPHVDSWATYERLVDDLVACGAIESVNELRWDVRPAPKFGTVESRIADGAVSLTDLAAVSGLTACLAEEARRSGGQPALPEWLIHENRWRAARYGLDAEFAGGEHTSVREAVREAALRLAPIADEIGASDALACVHAVLETGSSAERQRAAYARGGNAAVISQLIDELRR